MTHEVICKVCDVVFSVPHWRFKRGDVKYCSYACHQKGVATFRPFTWGDKISKANMGKKSPWLAEYNRTHIRRGSQTGAWKGDDVGYIAIHNWAHRHVGLKKSCELCGSKKKLEMANKSQQYKREIEDWRTLCMPCHRAHDAEFRRNGGVSRKRHRWKKKNSA